MRKGEAHLSLRIFIDTTLLILIVLLSTFIHGTVILDIPPREQWCWSDQCPGVGYCGETGLQSAALHFGSWVSQEIVRNSDGPCSSSQKLTGVCQLLVGVNDVTSATNLKLKYTKWNSNLATPQSTAFLSWIKSSLDLGYPIVAGFYAVGGTDSDYDHIMTIIGYDSATSGTVSYVYWNDFSQQKTTKVSVSGLFKTRSTCTDSAQSFCLPLNTNFAIRIEGNQDSNGETLRAKLSVSSWTEPDYSSEDQVSPKPAPIQLASNLTISGVTKGYQYAILRFDDYSIVPVSNFGKSTQKAKQYCFTAPADGIVNVVVPDKLLSNQSYFFRIVLNNTCTPSAPAKPVSPFNSIKPIAPGLLIPPVKPMARIIPVAGQPKKPIAPFISAPFTPVPKPAFPVIAPVAPKSKPTRPLLRPDRPITKPSFPLSPNIPLYALKPSAPLTLTSPTKPVAPALASLSVILDIPPREQWCWSDQCPGVGYCGETGLQSAALHFGSWVSQEIVRNSDGPCSSSQKLTGVCQLLVGVNDVTSATNLKLKYTKWNSNLATPQSTAFLSWIKSSLDLGYPIVAGFYAVGGTDSDYDHIMTIIGYDSATSGTVSYVYWNDFSQQKTTKVSVSGLFKTRSTCTDSAQSFCLPLNTNFAIRIEGNQDSNGETLRAKLSVSSWTEPDYSSEDQVSPKPAPIQLASNLTISGVTKGYQYAILRFDDYSVVPISNFGSSTRIAKQYCFTAPTDGIVNVVVPDKLLSNQSYFFRVVRNSSCFFNRAIK